MLCFLNQASLRTTKTELQVPQLSKRVTSAWWKPCIQAWVEAPSRMKDLVLALNYSTKRGFHLPLWSPMSEDSLTKSTLKSLANQITNHLQTFIRFNWAMHLINRFILQTRADLWQHSRVNSHKVWTLLQDKVIILTPQTLWINMMLTGRWIYLIQMRIARSICPSSRHNYMLRHTVTTKTWSHHRSTNLTLPQVLSSSFMLKKVKRKTVRNDWMKE